jgi:hypothetical protein
MAAAFVLVGFPALAGAHAGNNDPNMVHACVGNVSQAARIVGVGVYQASVEQHGGDALLAERAIDRYGHCTFTPDELGAALAALVGWVEFGVPPTP